MPRARHYSPEIRRPLVSALYHEAKHRRMPMTRLANQILAEALAGTVGWQQAGNPGPVPPQPTPVQVP